MGKEYIGKSFKSGNSVAIRLPAALGVLPDREWTVARDENGDLILKIRDKPKRKFNIDKIWGIGKGLGLKILEPEDRLFEERALLWDEADQKAGDTAPRGGAT